MPEYININTHPYAFEENYTGFNVVKLNYPGEVVQTKIPLFAGEHNICKNMVTSFLGPMPVFSTICCNDNKVIGFDNGSYDSRTRSKLILEQAKNSWETISLYDTNSKNFGYAIPNPPPIENENMGYKFITTNFYDQIVPYINDRGKNLYLGVLYNDDLSCREDGRYPNVITQQENVPIKIFLNDTQIDTKNLSLRYSRDGIHFSSDCPFEGIDNSYIYYYSLNLPTGLSVFDWSYTPGNPLLDKLNSNDVSVDIGVKQVLYRPYQPFQVYDDGVRYPIHINGVNKKKKIYTVKFKDYFLHDDTNFIVTNNNTTLFLPYINITHKIDFNNFIEPRPDSVELSYYVTPKSEGYFKSPLYYVTQTNNVNEVYSFNNISQINSPNNIISTTFFYKEDQVINTYINKTGIREINLRITCHYTGQGAEINSKRSDYLIINDKNYAISFTKNFQNKPINNVYTNCIVLNNNSLKFNSFLRNSVNDFRISTSTNIINSTDFDYQLNPLSQESKFFKLSVNRDKNIIESSGPHPKSYTISETSNRRFVWSKDSTILRDANSLTSDTLYINGSFNSTGNYNVKVYEQNSLIHQRDFVLGLKKADVAVIFSNQYDYQVLTNRKMLYDKNKKITFFSRYIRATDFTKLKLISENSNIIEVVSPFYNAKNKPNGEGFFEALLIKNAGTCKITIYHEASNDYLSNSVDVTFTITKSDQFVTHDFVRVQRLDQEELPAYVPISGYCYYNTFGGTKIEKNGLVPVYTSSNTSIAEIEGENIKIKGFGNCLINSSHPGNDTFNPVPENQGFQVVLSATQVTKTRPNLAWNPFGAILDNYTVFKYNYAIYSAASSESNADIIYTSSNPIAFQDNNVLSKPLQLRANVTGTVIVTANQPRNDNYKAAFPIQKTITISGAYPGLKWDTTGQYYDAESIPKPYISNKDFLKENTNSFYIKYNSNDTRVINPINSNFGIEIVNTGITEVSVYGPDNTYNNLIAPVYYQESLQKTIRILPQSQLISFNPNDFIKSGVTNFEWSPNLIFNPFVSSNISRKNSEYPAPKVEYMSSNIDIISPCEDNGNLAYVANKLKVIKPGTVVITGLQNGGTSLIPTKSFFRKAENFVKTYTILKKKQNITYNNLPRKFVTNISEILNLNNYFNIESALPITYTSSNPSVAEINQNNLIIKSAGTTNIIANQIGDDYYSAASSTGNFIVEKITNPVDVEDIPNLVYGRVFYRPSINNLNNTIITSISSSNQNIALGSVINSDPIIYIKNPGKASLTFTFAETPLYLQKTITKQLTIKGPPFLNNFTIYTKINQQVNNILNINNEGGDLNEIVSVTQNSMPNYFGLSNRTITGFYNRNGTYTGNISLSNNYGTTGQNIVFQIAPIITGAKNISTKVDNLFSFPIGTSGTVNYYTGVNLPPGLFIVNNYITGTPTQRGIFASDISVGYNDGLNFNYTTEIFNFEIRKNLPIVLIPEIDVTGYVGYPFDYKIKYDENPNRSPENFSTSNLPNGLVLNSIDGLIYGKAKNIGTSSIQIKAYNNGGESSPATVNLTFLANTSDIPCLK